MTVWMKGLRCDGCGAEMPEDDVHIFSPGPRAPSQFYHFACWQTGWYTGIEPKGEWPTPEGKPPANLPGGDPVNSPSHYRWLPNGIEVIDITETLNFCLGNAIKYILRADHKGNPIEDLRKAAWYIEREIARRESGE